jgi:rod shape-determining protein MreD
MTDVGRADVLGYLGLWLAIFAAALFLRILPLDLPPGGLPGPDLMLALTMAWVLRRPSHLPALAIALVWLVEDLLMLRPPGLWALIVLAGTEFLRARHVVVREITFLLEWVMVASVLAVMTLGYRLVLAIVMVPQDPLDLSLMRLGFTVASYPAMVLLLHVVLRVRKPATGEVDELGRKL